jgi:hypothetical protein
MLRRLLRFARGRIGSSWRLLERRLLGGGKRSLRGIAWALLSRLWRADSAADATMANRSKMTDLFTFNAVCLPIFASLLHPQQIREEPSALDADFRAGLWCACSHRQQR